jgi:hypothetical protein
MNNYTVKSNLDRVQISFPITTHTSNTGYGDLLRNIVREEKIKVSNDIKDLEKIKFRLAQYQTNNVIESLSIKFFFKNNTTSVYENNWLAAGFTNEDITEGRKRLTKSFFRLDFFDSPNDTNQNYLFSEFLDIGNNGSPSFSLTGLYWIKKDGNFLNDTNPYRELYMKVRFYNASNGLTKNFVYLNPPDDINLSDFNNNLNVKYVKIKILNPYLDNVNNFSSKNKIYWIEPINGNSTNEIIFTELNFI